MTFKIPKEMKFDEISPRKGRGSSSSFRKTVRCGIYIWNKTNVRLNTVIGSEVSSCAGIVPGSPVQVQVGIQNDLVIVTYSKASDENGAHYKAKANGKRPSSADIRVMITLDKHLHDYFQDVPIKLVNCEHMIRQRCIIVRIHNNLLRNPECEDDLTRYQEGMDKNDPQGILGF